MSSNVKAILLRRIQIYTEGKWITNGYIKIKDQKITELGQAENLSVPEEFEILDFPLQYKAVPGFIDVHIHGANGVDTMDATKEALDTVAQALPGEGTKKYLRYLKVSILLQSTYFSIVTIYSIITFAG